MGTIKAFLVRRWKHLAGLGLVWISMEVSVAAVALVWGWHTLG